METTCYLEPQQTGVLTFLSRLASEGRWGQNSTCPHLLDLNGQTGLHRMTAKQEKEINNTIHSMYDIQYCCSKMAAVDPGWRKEWFKGVITLYMEPPFWWSLKQLPRSPQNFSSLKLKKLKNLRNIHVILHFKAIRSNGTAVEKRGGGAWSLHLYVLQIEILSNKRSLVCFNRTIML